MRVRQSRRLPRPLTDDQLPTLVEACEHRRDRFLLLLMAETALRIGQALGLRHADFVSRRRELRIVPRRDNVNGARAKTFDEHTIPISPGLVRLYTEYMFDEYGVNRRMIGHGLRRTTISQRSEQVERLVVQCEKVFGKAAR